VPAAKGRNIEAFVSSLPFCKKNVGYPWNPGSFLAKSRACHDIHEMTHQSVVCYGDYYNYVLVYLEGTECVTVQQ
jgi:hypothetical protein